jgi:signal transduction histidine kinase
MTIFVPADAAPRRAHRESVSEARRDQARVVDPAPASELRDLSLPSTAVALVSIWIVLLMGSHLTASSVRTDVLAIVGVSVVTALVLIESFFTFIIWRVAGDARAVTMIAAGICLAVFPLVLGVLAPNLVHSAALDDLRPAAALAGLPGVFLLAASGTRRCANFARRAGQLVGGSMLVSLAVLAALAVPARSLRIAPGPALPLAGPYTSIPLALTFAGLAVVHALAGRRRSGRLLSWSALALAGVSGAFLIEVGAGDLAHPAAWTMAAIAVAAALYGAGVDLQRHDRRRRAEGREVLVAAALATTRAQAVQDSQQEQRHQATSALLGIEAAAQGLSRNRALLTEPEFDQLSEGLIAEIHRLRSLIEMQAREALTRFDLREAIEPVLLCARASGLELTDAVPRGIEVVGVPTKTAEAFGTLLQNAQDHAPGSRIDVRAEVTDGVARLWVEDRGPGLAPAIADAAFERGVRSSTSAGSGLGLYVAHRLMDEQAGSIRAEARPGGGTSIVLEHQLARASLKVVAS